MNEMTSHERFKRTYEHCEADRVPIIDSPWGATIERWQKEGMPKDANWADFFGVDKTAMIWADNSPRYEIKILEEKPEYRVSTTNWGVTLRNWTHAASTPEFLDFTIKDRESWAQAKARMTPTRDRIDWKGLEKNYPAWRKEGRWIGGHLWFGFDITHSWVVGTERVLIALIEDPEWCAEMFQHELDMGLALLDMVWDAGYTFDEIFWPDDMGYKLNQFFSIGTYRELVKPVHKRAADWAHAKGIKVRLHSCGDIRPFISDLVEIGIDCLNPIEAETRRVVPMLKENGGYIFSSDHSVPSSVSLEDFRYIVTLAKELGSY